MALRRESHLWEILSKNKSVYEKAVRRMWGSCTVQVMGSVGTGAHGRRMSTRTRFQKEVKDNSKWPIDSKATN